jgi:hypothetical protein
MPSAKVSAMNASSPPQKPSSAPTGWLSCAVNRLAALLGKTAGIAARAGREVAEAALSSPEPADYSDERCAVLGPLARAARPVAPAAAEVADEVLQAYGDLWNLLSARRDAEERQPASSAR